MSTDTQPSTQTKKKGGFTLIEVIAVLVLLAILTAVALPRYIDMAANARDRAIDAGISELNGRESLTWGNTMISTAGWVDDGTVFAAISTDLNSAGSTDYTWTVAPSATGGTLQFQGSTAVPLTRTASTGVSPGAWSR